MNKKRPHIVHERNCLKSCDEIINMTQWKFTQVIWQDRKYVYIENSYIYVERDSVQWPIAKCLRQLASHCQPGTCSTSQLCSWKQTVVWPSEQGLQWKGEPWPKNAASQEIRCFGPTRRTTATQHNQHSFEGEWWR